MACKKGKTLHSQAREIIQSTYDFFKEEASSKSLSVPISTPLKRTAKATGVSISTVKRINKEADEVKKGTKVRLSSPGKRRQRPSYRNCVIGNFDKCVIRQTVQEYFIREKKVPSLRKLLPILKEKINFKWNRVTLRKVLHTMNFRWKKCNNNKTILIERPDIVFWRNNYLHSIAKFRMNGRTIVYIDETWLDDAMFGVQVDHSSKNSLIVVHAGSSEGFISGAELIFKANSSFGDCQRQITSQNFERWISEKLIPNLPPQCIICMDNAPYHTKKGKAILTKYATKASMLNWLADKSIPCNSTMHKAQLFDLIVKNSPCTVKYRVDEIFSNHGHEVLHLPPYHCDLNAIKYVWSSVKHNVKVNVSEGLNLDNLQVLVSDALKNVPKSEWKRVYQHIENVEYMYWERDGLMEEIVDNIIMKLRSSDLESDETDTDAETADEISYSQIVIPN